MEWLQQLDVGLFRFINGTLSNPFFDEVMPFVSHNPFSGPYKWLLVVAIVTFAAVTIWKRFYRLLICGLMAGIIIGTGDGLLCRNLKHTIQRPRPYSVLPDVKRPGETRKPAATANAIVETKGNSPKHASMNTNSMPSAHAANWFAGTIVALVYFRKSIRVILPLACLVSFSRIYNGDHYPSDVLAGAIVGAGHAVAMLWLLNSLWQWAAPKWFPGVCKLLPSLTSPILSEKSSVDVAIQTK